MKISMISWIPVLNLIIGSSAINVGIGISDVTGPAVEVPMMGYGKSSQKTKGIHTRLYSRAFVFEESGYRNVFVSVDCGMMGQLVKKKVMEKLEESLGDDALYNTDNVILSATHTHSGPGGYMQYVLFQFTSYGFVQQSFQALVDGISRSILLAHDNMKPAKLYYNEGQIDDANINRSPTSYLANHKEELKRYKHDTDHTMYQLNIFHGLTDKPLGVINWFAVHPTSMNNTNHLISGDNKGLASQLLERYVNKNNRNGTFVAAFASTNLGDASPNLKGPKCINSGKNCDLVSSSCDGLAKHCIAFGPGKTMKDSTYIIGDRQFQESKKLLKIAKNGKLVKGRIRSIHQWIDMSQQKIHLDDGSISKTCPPALGHSFAAGTTDGPGELDFTQGSEINDNAFLNLVSGLVIGTPSDDQVACHDPKPILLNTGKYDYPYKWHPDIVDTQILQVGNILIAALPGEFTTMAGRMLRKAILEKTIDIPQNTEDTKVMLAGLSNVYTHYITTYEEYQKQRYEGASTIYGPHTLKAYLQQYANLTEKLLNNEDVPKGTPPPDLLDDQLSFLPSVVYDKAPTEYDFGHCILQPPKIVHQGDVVTVRFVTGNPRNDLQLDGTYLTVEKAIDNNTLNWNTVYTDKDWETEFEWFRTDNWTGAESEAEIRWYVPENMQIGKYRISHSGHRKPFVGFSPRHFTGTTNTFMVVE